MKVKSIPIELIKYCCYYCEYLDECAGLRNARGKPCYSAMGGKDYMKYCDVKDGKCATHSSMGGVIGELNKDCWKPKGEKRK